MFSVLWRIGFVERSIRCFSAAAMFTLFFTERNEVSKAPLTPARLSKGHGGKSGERWDEAHILSVCPDKWSQQLMKDSDDDIIQLSSSQV